VSATLQEISSFIQQRSDLVTFHRKQEIEARRKVEEEQRRIQELEDQKTAAALQVLYFLVAGKQLTTLG